MAGLFPNYNRVTYYAPGPGDRMEGGFETSRPNPHTGLRRPFTLDDFRQGYAPFVTLAGDPSRYGQSLSLGDLTYTSPLDRKSYTLKNVPGHVHDTGSAFRGRPDKLDVAVGDFTGWDPQQASAFVQADAGRRTVSPIDMPEQQASGSPAGNPIQAGDSEDTAIASGPPQGRKMPSLMDMFEMRDPTGQPMDLTQALRNSSNTMMALGGGLMTGRAGDAFTGALEGSKIDAASAYRQQQLAQQKMAQARQAAQDRQAQSNWERQFKYTTEDKAPVGWRKTADGGMEFIPKGPADPAYLQSVKAPKDLSATDSKAVFEAEDENAQLAATAGALKRARELNSQTFQGAGASGRAWLGAKLPDWAVPDAIADPKTAKATEEWQKTMGPEALKAMAGTLKGATTDFELRTFMDQLADPSTTADTREQIIKRMETLAARKMQINQMRMDQLRGRTYYKPGGGAGPEPAAGDAAAPTTSDAPTTGNPIAEAKHAIKMGAPRVKVIERLAKQGIRFNPKDLD